VEKVAGLANQNPIKCNQTS